MNDMMQKLEDARFILKSLGLPKKQYNDRSAWVFLALANVKPQDNWFDSSTPMLPTVEIMQFIREYYGMDYKPNSRETIRRQTLHQFEQAQIVIRNKDNPKRATNSKDNNYCLNDMVLPILNEFPNGKWEKKILEFNKMIPGLKRQYEKILDKSKIPIMLPNGTEIKLSPGKHNKLHADIINEFLPRFAGKGSKVLYIGDTASSRGEGGKLMILETEYLEKLCIPPMSHEKLPDVVVYDQTKNWLFLIEVVTSHGPVSPKRWIELEEVLKGCTADRIYVTAFSNLDVFRKNSKDIAWETEVWIAEVPDHMIHFNGDKFLGPHNN